MCALLRNNMIPADVVDNGPKPMDVDVDVIVIDDASPTTLEVSVPLISKKPLRKQAIPAIIRRQVWMRYIGEANGIGKCMCCSLADITPFSFECGHIISEFNGGDISVSNLRPICTPCNRSVGKVNMHDFMISNKIHFPKNWNGYK